MRATFATILLLASIVGCGEVKTSATLQSGPSFVLSGSGRLASFRVYGPAPGHKIATPLDTKSLTWYVQASDGYFKGSSLKQLLLTYGEAPQGYKQIVPSTAVVPKLTSGVVYYFYAETTDAPPAGGFFYLDRNEPTEIAVPGLCQSAFVGDVRPIKCGTGDPFVEPTDLDAFVRENRVHRRVAHPTRTTTN